MEHQRIAIYGGNGFVGTHIAEKLSAHDVCVLCLSRTGHKPVHLRNEAWSEKVRWCEGDASQPNIKKLNSATALVCSVGSPPVPTFSQEAYDQQLFNNGTTNVNAINGAREAGIKKLVLINANLPSFLQTDRFAYARGKNMAVQAAKDFVATSPEHKALIIKPNVIIGKRFLDNGKSIPLDRILAPAAMLMSSRFIHVERIADRATEFLISPEKYPEQLSIFAAKEI
ncbi:MAG: NAD-dependent epimerase/dehydratase family protein [Pseudomonadota bacterium]